MKLWANMSLWKQKQKHFASPFSEPLTSLKNEIQPKMKGKLSENGPLHSICFK